MLIKIMLWYQFTITIGSGMALVPSRAGDKPLPKPDTNRLKDAYIHRYASMS